MCCRYCYLFGHEDPEAILELYLPDLLGSVRKVGTGRIVTMIGWRPTWQGATNSQMRAGS